MEKEIIDNIRNSTVAIVIPISTNKVIINGSGFFVNNKGHIVTCEHVVRGLNDFFIMETDKIENVKHLGFITERAVPRLNMPVFEVSNVNNILNASMVSISKDYDYAILKVEIANSHFLEFGNFDDVSVCDDCLFSGFPFGREKTIMHKGMVSYKGKINLDSHKLKAIQINGIVNKGNSGGPLLSIVDRKVIGIIEATFGNVGPYLKAIIEGKIRTEGIGLGQIDFGLFAKEVSEAVDRHIQMGMGYAVSNEYVRAKLKEMKIL